MKEGTKSPSVLGLVMVGGAKMGSGAALPEIWDGLTAFTNTKL
jgi:hypothetical protein